MTGLARSPLELTLERPVLELSGAKLRHALQVMIQQSQVAGGVEVLVEAVEIKSAIFQKLMEAGAVRDLGLYEFEQMSATMPTVRRRVAKLIVQTGWSQFRGVIATLLNDAKDTSRADAAIKAFCAAFPSGKENRFVYDIAAELLHNMYPEQYPLMQRWVWDRQTNTGVLREIWHADDLDRLVIDVPNRYETFLVLREELSQFLSDNGVFRDMLWYVDLLQAQIYSGYINDQGGAYLKTDFGADVDPLEHLRRILGLDAGDKPGRSRFKTIDETAHAIAPALRN